MIEVEKGTDEHGDYLRIGRTLELTYPEANQLQADIRRELLAAGVTMRDAV